MKQFIRISLYLIVAAVIVSVELLRREVRDAEDVRTMMRDAQVAYHAGDLHMATDIYDSAIELMPEDSMIYFKASAVYLLSGRWRKAIEYAGTARNFDPNNRIYVRNYADVLYAAHLQYGEVDRLEVLAAYRAVPVSTVPGDPFTAYVIKRIEELSAGEEYLGNGPAKFAEV